MLVTALGMSCLTVAEQAGIGEGPEGFLSSYLWLGS